MSNTELLKILELFQSTDEKARRIASELLSSKLTKLYENSLDQRKLLKELIEYAQGKITPSSPESFNIQIYDYLYMDLDNQYEKSRTFLRQIEVLKASLAQKDLEIKKLKENPAEEKKETAEENNEVPVLKLKELMGKMCIEEKGRGLVILKVDGSHKCIGSRDLNGEIHSLTEEDKKYAQSMGVKNF